MKIAFLFPLPILLLASLYPASGWIENYWRSPTFHGPLNPRSEGGCNGANVSACYKAIIEYIEKGEATIRISNATDAVIVIGLTRVGKSTMTQFVANYSNPLVVQCEFTQCYLLDDSGDGGNDVISKTFVPNTVEHLDENGVITPFYDMPGFDDTRGVAVEIANSFFIQKVIKGIERIKIIVVAKHASFTSTETSFKKLMDNLIKLTRTPEKFKDSIILIGNMAIYGLPDEPHFGEYLKYINMYNESMDKDNSSHPPVDKPVVRGWMNTFTEAEGDNPEKLTNVALFRSPLHSLNGTSIRDDPLFQEDYHKIKNLIWERTVFSPVSSDQMGFTLSIEAEKFLVEATLEASTGIKQKLVNFTTTVSLHLKTQLQLIMDSNSEDIVAKFVTNYNTMKLLDFQECNSLPASSPQFCMNEIQNQLSSLAEELGSDVFDEIHTMIGFLQFVFANVNKPKNYDMTEWVTGFQQIPLGLETDIKLKVGELSSAVRVRLINFSNEIGLHLENLVENISKSASESEMKEFMSHFNAIKTLDVQQCSNSPDLSPEGCVNQISNQTSSLANEMGNPIFQEIRSRVTFLQLAYADIRLNKSYDMTEWTSSFREIPKFVEDATGSIAKRVNELVSAYFMDDFSRQTRLYFQTELLGLQNKTIPGDEDLVLLNETIKELSLIKSEKFESCVKLGSPNSCYHEILKALKYVIAESGSNIVETLVKPVSFLEFVHNNFSNTGIDLRDWLEGFSNLQVTVGDENEATVEDIYSNHSLQAKTLAASISLSILSKIPNFTVIVDLTEHLREMESQLNSIGNKLGEYGDKGPIVGYIELIIKEYSKLDVGHIDTSILRLNFIRMIENIKPFPWYTASWGDFHNTGLAKPVSVEYSVFKFLQDLFSDLESSSVQINGALHEWKESTSEVDKINFDEFWSKFKNSGINAMTIHAENQGAIKEHIGLKEYSRLWLNQALDYTLLWKSACPGFTTDLTLFRGRYMSLSFVEKCLSEHSKLSQKIVVLSDEIFFFDKGISLTDKFDKKVQIFVISRHFDTTKQGPVQIYGKNGLPPATKPVGDSGTAGQNGDIGSDASDIIGVYSSIDGSPVIVSACGGNGGKGQDGGDGKDSNPTSAPTIDTDDGDGRIKHSQCGAWSGRVKLHEYPNSCNRATDDGCGAGKDGTWVAIWGLEPENPIYGGQGGNGGKGGLGGLAAMLDASRSTPTVTMFSNGAQGETGAKGWDGRKGTRGATCIRVDDKHCASCAEYRCYLKQSGDINNQCSGLNPRGVEMPVNAFSNRTEIVSFRGAQQPRNSQCTTSTSYNYDVFGVFKEYVKTFYNNANQNLNIFNRSKMSKFLDYVKNHDLLLKGEVV